MVSIISAYEFASKFLVRPDYGLPCEVDSSRLVLLLSYIVFSQLHDQFTSPFAMHFRWCSLAMCPRLARLIMV